jgi:hypothetical protein
MKGCNGLVADDVVDEEDSNLSRKSAVWPSSNASLRSLMAAIGE